MTNAPQWLGSPLPFPAFPSWRIYRAFFLKKNTMQPFNLLYRLPCSSFLASGKQPLFLALPQMRFIREEEISLCGWGKKRGILDQQSQLILSGISQVQDEDQKF